MGIFECLTTLCETEYQSNCNPGDSCSPGCDPNWCPPCCNPNCHPNCRPSCMPAYDD